jgi:hypothetical protein
MQEDLQAARDACGRNEALLGNASRRNEGSLRGRDDDLRTKLQGDRRRVIQVINDELGGHAVDEAGVRSMLVKVRTDIRNLRECDARIRGLVTAKTW